MTARSSQASRLRRWVALLVAMAIAFAAHAHLAARSKSSTFDEPLYALSSWMIVNLGDFRLNPEHPALWKYVPGLATFGQPLAVDLDAPSAKHLLVAVDSEMRWANDTLYQPRGDVIAGEALVARARIPMLLFPLLLALLVARWSWTWGGPLAAVLATTLLIFDPNLLAHGGLVVNDVAAALLFTLAAYLTWRLGERFGIRTAIGLALTCAAALGTKYSAPLLAPMIGLPLLYRALDRGTWPARGTLFGERADIRGRSRRLALVLVIGVMISLVSWASLWPMYQFRDAPTPAGLRFDDGYPRFLLGQNTLENERDRNPRVTKAYADPASFARAAMAVQAPPVARLTFALADAHLVPQTWSHGLVYTNAAVVRRDSYLMGEHSFTGFASFFPLAVLFKTPIATLLILLVCAVGGTVLAARRIRDAAVRWKLVCLFIPPAIFFAVACASNLNIGLRHVLPIFPPMYVAAGVLMARAIREWRLTRFAVPLALVGLAVETLAAFPNYLPFFNVAAGGSRGGLRLLSDSNLDWGQDLKPLASWYADWRREHPTEPFYLSYFGSVPPSAYGIDYINAAPGTVFDPRPPVREMHGGVYAVSATHLQGAYTAEREAVLARTRTMEPLGTINGTIYLYRVP